jgi:outer membrane biosynthesis protein TonB
MIPSTHLWLKPGSKDVNDRGLCKAFSASLLIHLTLVPVASLLLQNNRSVPIMVPIKLVDMPRVEKLEEPDSVSRKPLPKAKAQKIIAPRLLSKPEIFETPLPSTTGNIREQIKESQKPVEKLPPLASLPPEPDSVKGGWNPGSKPGEAEGGAAGSGDLFGKGDAGVVGGTGLEGGGGGQGISGLGRGAKGDWAGAGGRGSSEALSGFARPLGGYQVKPQYPESARRAGAQGITLLKLRVLENGKVGEVHIEKSTGHAGWTKPPRTQSSDGCLNRHEWVESLWPSGFYYR